MERAMEEEPGRTEDCSVALVVFLFPVPAAHSSLFPGVNRYFHTSFCLTRVIKVGFFRIFQSLVDSAISISLLL